MLLQCAPFSYVGIGIYWWKLLTNIKTNFFYEQIDRS